MPRLHRHRKPIHDLNLWAALDLVCGAAQEVRERERERQAAQEHAAAAYKVRGAGYRI